MCRQSYKLCKQQKNGCSLIFVVISIQLARFLILKTHKLHNMLLPESDFKMFLAPWFFFHFLFL